MQYLTYYNQAEIMNYVTYDLRLHPYLVSDTLSKLDYGHLLTLSKKNANVIIRDIAEELTLQRINGQLQNLFELAGVSPPREYYLVDFILNRVQNFRDVHAAYENLVTYGLDSSTFMDVLTQIQSLL